MSTDKHWSEDELVGHLYAVGPHDGHLDACESCRNRASQMQRKRETLLAGRPVVSDNYLANQRHSIRVRLASRPRVAIVRMVPSLAAAAALLIAFLIFKPAPKQEATSPVTDTQFFEEVFSLASDPQPTAVEPVQHLFEVRQ